jgi:hypothetical protein
MMNQILTRFLLPLAVTIPCVRSSAQNVVLGVLEENRGHYAGEPNYRAVRVIFEKKVDEWLAFRSDCNNQACLKAVTSSYPSLLNSRELRVRLSAAVYQGECESRDADRLC